MSLKTPRSPRKVPRLSRIELGEQKEIEKNSIGTPTFAQVTFNEDDWAEDGFVDILFEVLWNCDGITRRPFRGLLIPDTAVYAYGSLRSYYFTSLSGVLMKRGRRLTHSPNVIESMCRPTSVSDVCAVGIQQKSRAVGGKRSALSIRYLTSRDLTYTLQRGGGISGTRGLLQKYIDSKPDLAGVPHTSTIQAVWSPNLCFLETYTNNHSVTDTKVPLSKRCGTIEGGLEDITTSRVSSPSITQRIVSAMNQMVGHFQSIMQDTRVLGMVSLFRIDSADRLWFLWCSSLRTALLSDAMPLRRPLPLDAPFSRITSQASLGAKISFECSWCHKQKPTSCAHRVSYRSLALVNGLTLSACTRHDVKQHSKKLLITVDEGMRRQELREALGKVDESYIDDFLQEESKKEFDKLSEEYGVDNVIRIPRWIKRIHPHMNGAEYHRMLAKPHHLDEKIEVCDICYVRLTQNFTSSGRPARLVTRSTKQGKQHVMETERRKEGHRRKGRRTRFPRLPRVKGATAGSQTARGRLETTDEEKRRATELALSGRGHSHRTSVVANRGIMHASTQSRVVSRTDTRMLLFDKDK